MNTLRHRAVLYGLTLAFLTLTLLASCSEFGSEVGTEPIDAPDASRADVSVNTGLGDAEAGDGGGADAAAQPAPVDAEGEGEVASSGGGGDALAEGGGGDDVVIGPGDMGSPCEESEDCKSGYCVQSADGDVCTKTCTSECPEGWSCEQLLSGGDAVYICLPLFPTLCMPCTDNADCQLPGGVNNARCIPVEGEGAFCGASCSGGGCPDGYTCEDTQDVLGQSTSQCVKSEGLCECSVLAVNTGAMTSCALTNDYGTCPSMRQCTDDGLSECDGQPAGPELCDGLDNDCDPATVDGADEGALGEACDGEDLDLCAEGTLTCEGGALVCTDMSGDSLDVCDGEDNDCDPESPDGSADPEFGAPCESADDADSCEEDSFVCEGGEWICQDVEGATLEICDGLDNDCNEASADGSQDPDFNQPCDGDDADLCADGLRVCVEGTLTCTDSEASQSELCDGLDNDCDPTTPDGAGEPTLGAACDGEDGDLCEEGVIACVEGQLLCTDPNDDSPDVCDGEDNDCDPNTLDGVDDEAVGLACDGDDSDTCEDGVTACIDAQVLCVDAADPLIELCDGVDNDCDPSTVDGSGDPALGEACDGEGDQDLCAEGERVCVDGALTCDDPGDDDPDLCDGVDNDCNALTPDGLHDPQLDAPCDGADSDLCEEGTLACVAGALTCDDVADDDIELCDGLDNDCDPATVDGEGDPNLTAPCDGDDADLCQEGALVCAEGALLCDDPNDEDLELCDGEDNDCNPATPDGLNEPSLNAECDGDDADLCVEGLTLCHEGQLICDEAADDDSELCDGQDNDCDASVDEGFPNTDGTGFADCLDEDDDDDGVLDGLDCEPQNPEVFPTCMGKQCGDNGCGESCGSCSGQDACVEGQCVCQPNCGGKDCGGDGCGGSCGSCSGQDACVNDQCVCQAECSGQQCGDDGCGGSCGGCSGQDACVGGQCVCQPNCAGKQCGGDGCGGSCGACFGQDACVNDQCVCQPNCAGKQCGDDGCGGSCGGCGQFQECNAHQCACVGPHFGWVGNDCRPSCGGLLGIYGQPDSGEGCCPGGGGCKGIGWPKGPSGSYDCDWCCASVGTESACN